MYPKDVSQWLINRTTSLLEKTPRDQFWLHKLLTDKLFAITRIYRNQKESYRSYFATFDVFDGHSDWAPVNKPEPARFKIGDKAKQEAKKAEEAKEADKADEEK